MPLHDRIKKGFTLLQLTPTVRGTDALVKAVGDLGAPIELLRLDEPVIRRQCGADLLLIRPDLHVAWRGDQPPADPARLAAQVTGY
jgi:hypothetical protein